MLIPSTLLVRPAALATTLATTGMRTWAAGSQQRARRNAMIAATACAERRAQREDVADYLAHRAAGSPPDAGATVPRDRAARG